MLLSNSAFNGNWLTLPLELGVKVASFLDVETYLSFRRVSKGAKNWCDCLTTCRENRQNLVLNNSNWRNSGIQVTLGYHKEKDKKKRRGPTLTQYLKSNLMVSNFAINTENLFEQTKHKHVKKFLLRFSSQITSLTVSKFNGCVSRTELKFYESLKNLRKLEIQLVDVDRHRKFKIPRVFRKLMHFKIHKIETRYVRRADWFLLPLYRCCPLVQEFSYPQIWVPPKFWNIFQHLIIRRNDVEFANTAKPKVPITDLDMAKMPTDPRVHDAPFWNLVRSCAKLGVRLHNYDPRKINSGRQNYEKCIVSIKGMMGGGIIHELTNLEKITVKSSWGQIPEFVMAKEGTWPLLSSIDLTLDTGDDDNVVRICNILFCGGVRSGVEELKLEWANASSYFPIHNIIRSLPGLKRLILKGWAHWEETDWDYNTLWFGLRNSLEELEIEDCETLSDAALEGLQELKHLKTLRLKGLDKMLRVTDEGFKSVLRHLPLNEFQITSSHPLKMVTKEGIVSLAIKTSEFSKTIKKFPFRGWSIEGERKRTFREIRNLFRCNL